jgi:Flp pilus assembly protein TadD
MNKFRHLLALFVILLSSSAWSADTAPKVAPDPELTQARELIAKKDWGNALQVLEGYTRAKPASADGFNLLGYSLRNLKRFEESLVAYEQALKLDPAHRGAHEYIGVAYIQMGQLGKAKEHMDALDKLCTFSCEEYRDLKKAYEEASKKSGN